MEQEQEFEGWALLELMGHRKLAGHVKPATIAGAGVIRIDVPGADGNVATQFYSPASLYCLTPIGEELARKLAQRYAPEPVTRWDLPPAIEARANGDEGDFDDDEMPL
jgi:hypothetical protein